MKEDHSPAYNFFITIPYQVGNLDSWISMPDGLDVVEKLLYKFPD